MNPDRLGTAQWADPRELSGRHPYREGAVWLGRTLPGEKAIGVQDDRHVCLVAGTRAGKGTSIIIPNLCLWPGSAVVVDPTGDHATITAARRGAGTAACKGMGQRVYVLDPYAVARVDESLRAHFNPLDMLDPGSKTTIRSAERIAASLVPPSKDEEVWAQNGARRLLAGLILHVVTAPEFEGRRNLVTVRDLVFRGDLVTMDAHREQAEEANLSSFDLLWAAMTTNPAFSGHISGSGEAFRRVSRNAPEQWEGVHDAALSATNFINNDDMRACLAKSDFQLSDLKTDVQGVTVYLTIPSKDKIEDFRWLRLMVSLVMTEMESTPAKPSSGHPVLMILDEFASLQRMDRIEAGIAEIAKFGVKLFIVVQNLGQLKIVYGDNWETFLSNCGVRVFFGVDDHFTRDYVSNLVGETELIRTAASKTDGTNEVRTLTDTVGGSRSRQDTIGRSKSDSYKGGVLNFRDTAGLLRKLAGSVSATDSRETSTSTGQSTERSRALSIAVGRESSSTQTEHIHKRQLVTPDEVGRLFSRISESANPFYPGLAIVLISDGSDPAFVRRVNYYEDHHFAERYQPAPEHAESSQVREYNVGLYGLEKLKLLSGRVHPELGPMLPAARWLVEVGASVRCGDPVLEIESLLDEPPAKLLFKSPVSGQMLRAHTIDNSARPHKWLMVLVGREQEPDSSIVEANRSALRDCCLKVMRAARVARRNHIAAGGIKALLVGGAIAWLVLAWPGWLLASGLLLAILGLLYSGLATSLNGALVTAAIASTRFDDIEGDFIVEGPFRHDPEWEEKRSLA